MGSPAKDYPAQQYGVKGAGLAETHNGAVPKQFADSLSLSEIVVTGTRYDADMRHLPMTVTTIGQTTLEQHHRSSIVPTLTEQVPGLFATSRGMLGYGVSGGAAGQFSVRGIGSSPNTGMLVLVDGVPQYAGLYGHSIPDACQTMLAERVEVVRGPASMLYGSNAMGGVVNIITRRMQHDGIQGCAQLSAGSYGTVEGNAVTSLRKGRWNSTTGLSYGRTDGHRANAEFEQYTAFAKLQYALSEYWSVSGDLNVTHFNASNPGEVHDPYIDNDQRITRGTATAGVANRYEHLSGALRVYYNWGHHHINDGYHPGGTPPTQYYLHDDLMAGVSVYESATLVEGNRLTIGADWLHYGGHAWNEAIATGATTDIAHRTENTIAGYMDVHQDIAQWLSANVGLRIDHHTRTGTTFVPQGGLALRLPHETELKAMVGKGFRNPTIREMYMYPPQNPDLRPEQLINYELSYRRSLLDGRLQVGANLFHLRGKDLIATVRTDGKPQNMNIHRVANSGTELTASYTPSPAWHLHVNYSYLHMEYPVIAAPRHKAYASAGYRYHKLSLSAGVQYIGGLYTSLGDNPTQESYLLCNLTADYHLLPYLTLFVKGDNLLGQVYEVNYGFPMPGTTVMAGASVRF